MDGNVLITGGAGFLGRAILRRARREGWRARFFVYSRDEMKQVALKHRYPEVRCILGDVRDGERLEAAMSGMDTVIHAAALKHIPEAEFNVNECIDVNVAGSRAVAIAAARAEVTTVIGLSTDKAAAPLNTYGMTKALMERVFGEANELSETRLACVRYGNVISSTGSVVPLFRQQMAEHREIRVTHPDMTRFWLSADEAIDLILFAANCASAFPGAVFVPRCPAMRITELAQLIANEDEAHPPMIRYTGLRAGEKLHETLVQEAECPRTITRNGNYIILPATFTGAEISDAEPIARAPYSSEAPAQWLPASRMLELIEDAATV